MKNKQSLFLSKKELLKEAGVDDSPEGWADGSRVHVNGDIFGLHKRPQKLVQRIKNSRRSGKIRSEVSIRHDTENKDVFIFGGGDSALDWCVELAEKAKSLSLVHRRDAFRGAQHTEEQMRELVAAGKVKLLTPYLIDSIEGSDKVTGVSLKNFDTNEIEHYEADELLFLFGLNKKLPNLE